MCECIHFRTHLGVFVSEASSPGGSKTNKNIDSFHDYCRDHSFEIGLGWMQTVVTMMSGS